MKIYLYIIFLALLALIAMGGCETPAPTTPATPAVAATPVAKAIIDQPKGDVSLDWDRAHKDGKLWTMHIIDEIEDTKLPDIVPTDFDRFCPAYTAMSRNERAMFWAHLAVGIASYETDGYNPKSEMKESDGSRSIGLFQLSYGNRHCPKSSSDGSLKDPFVNISCAVGLMEDYVRQDKVIAIGGYVKYGAKSPKGFARYWSVIRDADKKRKHHKADIQSKTKRLDICR